ncbi:MAG TPA: dihydroorotase [Ignavibacteria bacterium]|nr:dihydroorotase [Ignavibacteria bacterium]HRB00128.1 dihydroorotase [Ignavibacteria bacterium]
MNLYLKNIKIISPEDGIDTVTDMLIVNGHISKIGNVKRIPKDTEEIDMKGKTAIPGIFDMHVHFRYPGQTHKEDLYSGSMSAANGGVTGVLCMPNTDPPIDSALIVKDIVDKTKELITDVEVSACATEKREGRKLSQLMSLSDAGAVAFTDDGSPVSDPEIMRRVLEYSSQLKRPVIQHCEDMRLSDGGVINEGFISTVMGVNGIPEISETSVIARDIILTDFVKNSHYHIQHISCGKSVELLRNAKQKNINVTGEVCPHHFILTDKECLEYNVNAKMNPPLRTAEDVEQILEGLRDGTIDVICTDHAPHTEYEKNQGFYAAPFGIVGLETLVGLTYTYLVNTGIISFNDFIRKLSINPRKILNLEKVKIAEGEPANLSILNEKAKWKIDKKKFMSKSVNTPFDGFEVQCKPYCVINNDKIHFTKL